LTCSLLLKRISFNSLLLVNKHKLYPKIQFFRIKK